MLLRNLATAAVIATQVAICGLASAQSSATASDQMTLQTAALGLETFRLWPGRAPQASSDGADEVPTLTLFRPHPGTANGTAVIVAPGGAYLALAAILEGRQVADWFSSRGITVFLLKYRVGPKARLPIPLIDGARAVRYVRANAARFAIKPDRVGMIGFSAGGHLTATTAGTADAGSAGSPDLVERASSKLDFAMLGYPWLEGMVIGADGKSQYCTFQQAAPCDPKRHAQYRPIKNITASFPPTFIYHTTADSLVQADGIATFYQALIANKVPAEMHIFANGQHGTGLGGADPALSHWPELLEQWLRGQGLLTKGS